MTVACKIWSTLCSSRKNPYSPHRRSSEIPRERGVLKANISKAKYKTKLEFPEGMGGAKQKPSMGGGGGENGYFLEMHIMCTQHSIH